MNVNLENTAQLLQTALQHHQAGQLHQAELLYRQILQQEPEHPVCYHLLGVIAHQVGKNDIALECINKAISLNAYEPAFYSNLGLVHQALGNLEMAVANFKQAIGLKPDFVEALNNLGYACHLLGNFEEAAQYYQTALEHNPQFAAPYYNWGNTCQSLKQFEEAVAHYQQAIERNPHYAEAYNNMGNALQQLGRMEEAKASFKQALQLQPAMAEAWYNYGNVCHLQERWDEAIAHYQKALEIRPGYAEACSNYGFALQITGHMEEALAKYDQAIALKPQYPDAHYNKGTALQLLRRYPEAMDSYKTALMFKPDYAEARNNLGTVYKALGQYEEALSCYTQAIEIKRDYGEPHWNQALIWLLKGDFEAGWPEYEWRMSKPKFVKRTPTTIPAWDGKASLKGKKVLLMAEQGLGDTFQFLRYISLLKKKGAAIYFEHQPELKELLTGCTGVDTLVDTVAPEAPTGDYDYYVFLMSLPGIFKTTVDTIPPVKSPLKLSAATTKKWQKRFAADKNFKVGVVWSGNPENSHNPERSCTLSHFAALSQVPGVSFYSLQKGEAAKQALTPPDGLSLINLDEELENFTDTAAAIKQLDLVMSVDTAVAHLAGLLETPVWTLLCAVPDWRWLLEREDCPWYPSMRLFRQTQQGEWDNVFEALAAALEQTVKPPKKSSKSKK